jgi:hypothetical protein
MKHFFFSKLKDLLLRSINAWCDLLKPENHLNVPVIRMELTFDDQKMQFYPSVVTIRDLLFSIVDKLSTALPNVSETDIKRYKLKYNTQIIIFVSFLFCIQDSIGTRLHQCWKWSDRYSCSRTLCKTGLRSTHCKLGVLFYWAKRPLANLQSVFSIKLNILF